MALSHLWRHVETLTMNEAAYLMAGLTPNSEEHSVDYGAAKAILRSGVAAEKISGEYVYMEGQTNTLASLDIYESLISVGSLVKYLQDRGINDAYFNPGVADGWMNPNFRFYAPRVGATLEGWRFLCTLQELPARKAKAAVENYLESNAVKFGLADEKGAPVNAAIGDILRALFHQGE